MVHPASGYMIGSLLRRAPLLAEKLAFYLKNPKYYSSIKKRDITDENRENSPLIRTTDSIYIDNTNLSKSDQLELALKFYKMIV